MLKVLIFLVCVALALSAKSEKGKTKKVEKDEPIPSSLLASAAAADVQGIELALARGDNIDTRNVNGWFVYLLS